MYIIVAVLITYPLIFNLNTVIPYFPDWLPAWAPEAKDWFPSFGDSHYFPWFLWWFKKALLDLHQNPLTTEYLFAPGGVFLGSSLENLVNIILSLPLQLFFSVIASYNLLIIFNFALAGTAVYYFADYFLKHGKTPAILAGLYFMTSSYMVLRSLGHFNLQTTAFLIFFLLFFIRMYEENRRRNSVLAAVFLFLTALSSWYYFFYGFVVALVITLYFFRCRVPPPGRSGLPDLPGVAVFSFISFVLLLPFLLLLYISNRAGVLHGHSLSSSIVYSSDFLSYFLPHRLGFLFHSVGEWADRFLGLWQYGGNTMEKTAFLGFTGLGGIIFYLIKGKADPRRGLWLLLLLISFVLSLGPLLTIAGQIFPVPLPYGILYYFLPFFGFLRTPNRFSVFVFLLAALFLGYFVRSISSFNLTFEDVGTRTSHFVRRVIVIVIAGLIVLDNLVWPYPLIKVGDTSFYQRLRADKADYLILNLPLREYKAANHPYLLAQTFHEKKMINGAVQPVGYTGDLLKTIRSYPLSLLNCDYQITAKEAMNQSMWLGDLKNYLVSQNVRYVIWHKNLPVLNEICPMVVSNQNLVINGEGMSKVYEDEEISVFATELPFERSEKL